MTDRPGDGSYPGYDGSSNPPPPPPPGAGGYPGYPEQPPAYPGQQPPAYPEQPPAYPQAYGSPDPNAYLGAPPAFPNYPGGPPGPPPGARQGWNGLAIAAFVVSFVPLIDIVVSLPLAIIGLVQIGRTRQRGKGLAVSAIVITVVWCGLVGLGIWGSTLGPDRNNQGEITEAGQIDFNEVRVGDCVKIPDPAGSGDLDASDVEGVPCGDGHNTEAVSLIPIAGDSYPGEQAIHQESAPKCVADVREYLHGDVSGFQPYRIIPTKGLWEDNDDKHFVICFVAKTGFAEMTSPVAK
ncbi:MAG: hypothetical protein ACRDQA_06155 [Nocardioidaceae bacterium]